MKHSGRKGYTPGGLDAIVVSAAFRLVRGDVVVLIGLVVVTSYIRGKCCQKIPFVLTNNIGPGISYLAKLCALMLNSYESTSSW